MQKWRALWSEGGAPRLLCQLCTPTVCPSCQAGAPCPGGAHAERPVRLRDGAARPPAGTEVIFPENMASAGFARLEAINYPPGALGAGAAGPVSIGHLVAFSRELEARLQHGGALGVVCSRGACANVLLLLGAHLVLARGLSAEEALAQLPRTPAEQQRFPAPWAREALWHAHSLTVRDCLVGLQTAVGSGWLDYGGFSSDEWLKLLKSYDASFTFSLPLKTSSGEPRRLTFYAMADPVTTVADPGVRPSPPEDGFVSDYDKLSRGALQRPRADSQDRKKRSPDAYASAPARDASQPGDTASKDDGREEDTTPDRRWSIVSARSQEDPPPHVPNGKMAMPASMPLGGVFRQSRKPGAGDCGGEDAHAKSARGKAMAASVALGDFSPGARTDSKDPRAAAPATPSANGGVTWLEMVRVRRWGQEQHGKQSSVPVGLVKEQGLTTLPEFGTWLRSVGCRRLVQLNRPNERVLPSTGSYMDYFAQWQLKQEALHFDDGSVPPAKVVRSLRSVVEEVMVDMDNDSPGKMAGCSAIVVHCAAGLGRTGTLLGVLAMEMVGIPGGAWMGWVRMCRPGSVQTLAQEKFLKTYRPARRAPGRAGALSRLLRSLRCAGAADA
ncbi:unnamed protein product [Prorocentrum cordatum]|uniref:Tyrosine specific protein phosphatases domain-containing protein n=1 Tax=Prorocentrum cordatum TaxID=2364126 RepID=A0ABN9QHP7_9DINO|nr:unnamed protein product [Polarella glacialis]